MNCETCKNYVPKRKPPFSGIKTDELQMGMVLKNGNPIGPLPHFRYVVLGKPGPAGIRVLRTLKGYKPRETTERLADLGCQPYASGEWHRYNWLKEVK